LLQLNKVCTVLGMQVLSPDILHNKHGWFAGFFDADGSIGYYFKGNYNQPQLTLSVTNKLYIDVIYFKIYFGGNIYFDKAQNGYYKWSVQSEENIATFVDYSKICVPRSIKLKRLFLIKEYYHLIKLKAHKASEDTILHKAWIKFNQKWNNYNFSDDDIVQ
jgi:ubiquinol-cytochrome c reductase cytochrome b subunit